MVTRISRKNLTQEDLNIVTKSMDREIDFNGQKITVNTGFSDTLDNNFKIMYRLNDAMYDYVADKGSDDELDVLTSEAKTFYDKRKIILVLNKLTKQYYDDISIHDNKC